MSYLSPQADEIIADNNRQPTDMTQDDWSTTFGSGAGAQATQGTSWRHRQRPRLRSCQTH